MIMGTTVGWAQNAQSASDYLSIVSGLQAEISHTNMMYFRCAVHCQDAQTIENSRMELLQQVTQALQTSQRMPGFKGDDFLKEETITFLKVLESNCNGEYIEINENFISIDDPIDAMDAYYELVEAAERKLERANDRFHRAFNIFAGRNDITIVEVEEGDLESEVARANRINAYYRAMNKLDFPVQRELSRVMQAVGDNSSRNLEHARYRLERAVNNAKYKLDQIGDFDGDSNLLISAQRNALILESLATEHLPAMVSYLEKPSNEHLDAYNAAVEFFNTQVAPSNEALNMAKENFLKDHVPKPPKGERRI